MNLREALIQQTPSLPLQRAAQAEVARLDAALEQAQNRHHGAVLQGQQYRAALQLVVDALLPANLRTPNAMARMDAPWPQAAIALWGPQS